MFANFPFPSFLQLPASGNGSLLQLFSWQTHIKIFLNMIHLSNQIENTDEQKAPAKQKKELKGFSRIRGFEQVVHHQENCNILRELAFSTDLQENIL